MSVLLAPMVMNFKEMNVFVLQERLSAMKQALVSAVQLISAKLAAIPTIARSVNQHLLWWMVFVLVLKALLWAVLLRNVYLVTSQIAKNVISKMFVQVASTAIQSTQVLTLVFQVQLWVFLQEIVSVAILLSAHDVIIQIIVRFAKMVSVLKDLSVCPQGSTINNISECVSCDVNNCVLCNSIDSCSQC